MTPRSQALYRAIRDIRSSFHQLKALGEELHQDLGVTVAMRAVMESLAEEGEQTVPKIARAKAVSRQHIQVNVDALAQAGLVTLRDNPGHKRSPLVALTGKGRKTFAGMRRREQGPLEQIAGKFTAEELRTASDILTRLKRHIVAARERKEE